MSRPLWGYARRIEPMETTNTQQAIAGIDWDAESTKKLSLTYEDAVLKLGRLMYDELMSNIHKGHWGGITSLEAFDRVREEFDEFLVAVTEGTSPADIVSEAADVANMLMMYLYSRGLLPAYANFPVPRNREFDLSREAVFVGHLVAHSDKPNPLVSLANNLGADVAETIKKLGGDCEGYRITVEKL